MMMKNIYDDPDRWTPSQCNNYEDGYDAGYYNQTCNSPKNDIHGTPYIMGFREGKEQRAREEFYKKHHPGWFK